MKVDEVKVSSLTPILTVCVLSDELSKETDHRRAKEFNSYVDFSDAKYKLEETALKVTKERIQAGILKTEKTAAKLLL